MTLVLSDERDFWFCFINNTLHTIWIQQYCSSLETRQRYIVSDGFETFPFPHLSNLETGYLDKIGRDYYTHRQQICLARNIGLTKVYNLFHEPTCTDADITELRRLHVAMDTGVAAAYGWEDLPLCHGFYGEGKETRYTLHPDAKSEVLRRLLTLNHERHAEEQASVAEEIAPSLDDALEARTVAKARKGKRKPVAEVGQLSTDNLLLEAFLEERSRRYEVPTAPTDADIEAAARMATYLIMRAEAPERLSNLRTHPARIRLTTPRTYRRTRLAKHLYYCQEMVRTKNHTRLNVTDLAFTEYRRGPYTPQILQAEQVAIKRGWLTVTETWDEGHNSVSYSLGPNADEAVKQTLIALSEHEPHLDQELVPLDEPKTTRAEQWTTIHMAWRALRDREGDNNSKEPTFEELDRYIHNWKPDRPEKL